MPRKKIEPHFIERPMPSSKEIRDFERQVRNEERGEEINGRLSEIYRDQKGRLVDVRKLEQRAKRQVIVTIFRWLFGLSFLGIAVWLGLLFFPKNQNNEIELLMKAPEKVRLGQEFSYQIIYKNNSRETIRSLKLELAYPENFIFTSVDVAPVSRDNYWTLADLPAGAEGKLEIKGMIINQENSANMVYAKLLYQQANFSSEL